MDTQPREITRHERLKELYMDMPVDFLLDLSKTDWDAFEKLEAQKKIFLKLPTFKRTEQDEAFKKYKKMLAAEIQKQTQGVLF